MSELFQFIRNVGKLVLAPVLLAVTFMYAMFQGGFVSWFLFYSCLPFGLYSLLFPFFALRIESVERMTNQQEYKAGDPFIATIIIKRSSCFPLLYMIIEEHLPQSLQHGQADSPKTIVFPWFKRTIECRYTLHKMPRGEHIFSSIRVKTGDMFGLLEKEAVYTADDRFLIYPQYVDIVYKTRHNQLEQGTSSSSTSADQDAAVSIGVREYRPGDRFSWIDWKSSARRNNMMTKEFEQQQSHDVVIFMDRTPSHLFEQVVTFTASLARAVLRKGSHTAFLSAGRERTFFPLRNGEQQEQQILYHLAKVQADAAFPLSKIAETELRRIHQPVTFMLVTSRLCSELEKATERVSLRNGHLLIFVVKEKAAPFSEEELRVLESLRKRSISVKVVYEGHYKDVFF